MNPINIKDFLKYYIGCPAVNTWFPIDHEAFDRGWILKGVEYGNDAGSYFLQNEKDETWTNSAKPILRRLNNITEGEGYEMITFAYGDNPQTMSWVTMADVLGMLLPPWPMYFRPGFQVYVRAINWLREHGFDCDGLIDAGLAVDAASLNQQTERK